VTQFGGPEVLHILDLPDPVAGPGQLRLRIHGATVNPTDTLLRSGARADMLRDIPPPYVPGLEAAGVLEQIGEGVATDLRVGDHVMVIVQARGSHGAYSERIVVPAEAVTRVPARASDVEAATLPMNGLTARRALDLLGLGAGQTLAVTGAAGAVGGYAVQLAKADGLWVIADASPDDGQLVEDLGADVVLARGRGFAQQVRRTVPQGVDALVDAALLNELVVPAVRDGGRVATVRGSGTREERGITFHQVFVSDYARGQIELNRLRQQLDRLRQQVEDGQVTLRVAQTFWAHRAAEAHRILEAGGTRGRLVLEF
jgi:NADPH:quinone reductase-like Zn-dependent oxidoreductase